MSARHPSRKAVELINILCEVPFQRHRKDLPHLIKNRKDFATGGHLHNVTQRARLSIAEMTGSNYHPREGHISWEDRITGDIELRFAIKQRYKPVYKAWLKYIKGFYGTRQEYQNAAIIFLDQYLILDEYEEEKE